TGDLTRLLAPRVGNGGRVLLADINGAMLSRGRDRLIDAGIAGNVDYLQVDGEHLPVADRSLHCVVIGFGLRNVTDKQAALGEMRRVLKPGGRALVLEFSQPVLAPLKPLYDAYSFQVLPRIGRLVAGDADSYRYLAESIRRHPDQDTLLGMLHQAGFSRCQYFHLAGGIVAVHRGYRL
ncbi:ubiquinone/menaquinone biosynthesis methyltransferase, partial [Immundisolibacter sp.]|uniref:ubiquinone/menaquinone biosynthesis methyltransferase n=1 Tax=Immundisolibacter sp. TaxID=1934948 RepID=UPI0035683D4D